MRIGRPAILVRAPAERILVTTADIKSACDRCGGTIKVDERVFVFVDSRVLCSHCGPIEAGAPREDASS